MCACDLLNKAYCECLPKKTKGSYNLLCSCSFYGRRDFSMYQGGSSLTKMSECIIAKKLNKMPGSSFTIRISADSNLVQM